MAKTLQIPATKPEEHPQAWWEGYACLIPKCNNPYKIGCEPHLEWLEGWHARYYGEKP